MSAATDDQIRNALAECQHLAEDEYRESLDAIWKDKTELVPRYGDPNETISMAALRFGRLAGVSLKRKFAKREEITEISKESGTGARWRWDFDYKEFEKQKARHTIEYQIVRGLYEARERKFLTFEDYVSINLDEGSWFRDLAHAVHPVLCKPERSSLIAAASKAVEKGFEVALVETVKQVQEALGGTSFEILPVIATAFLAAFIMKVGMKVFCSYAADSGKLLTIFKDTDLRNN